MKIFQNYISHIPTKVYETLLGEGIITGLKFPGTGASPEANQSFIDLARHLNCLIDNHGWNGITGQLHDSHFCEHITDFSGLENYLNLPNAWNFSSHIGAKSSNLPTRDISSEEFDAILLANLSKIRETIFTLTGKEANIYGEGLFPYYFDPRTTTPSFLNRTLKSSGLKGGLDGLVLDICHSTIAAKFIEIHEGKNSYSFYDYVADLNTSQIKIIHLSGTNNLLDSSTNDFTDDNRLDPHLRSKVQDFLTVMQLLKMCPNIEQISNEIAYSEDFGNPVTLFDYCSEAILTWFSSANPLGSIETLKKVSNFIAKELHKDCDNLYDVINTCKSFS